MSVCERDPGIYRRAVALFVRPGPGAAVVGRNSLLTVVARTAIVLWLAATRTCVCSRLLNIKLLHLIIADGGRGMVEFSSRHRNFINYTKPSFVSEKKSDNIHTNQHPTLRKQQHSKKKNLLLWE